VEFLDEVNVTIQLNELLSELSDRTDELLSNEPRVVRKNDELDVDDLPIAAVWHQLRDMVAVVFDMRHSTNLEKGRTPEGTASIYDAGVTGVVMTLHRFGSDFIDIQGDGGFGLFWGRRPYERAVCAAITVRSFSRNFHKSVGDRWPGLESTGFKVGLASGPVLVKRIGIPRQTEFQEPVWAGRPVNYAAKAAQQTEPERMLVTGSVWDELYQNDYLTFSCGCENGIPNAGTPGSLWTAVNLQNIPDEQRFGQSLETYWCERHGELFCNAVLDGQTRRSDIQDNQRSERLRQRIGTEELNEAANIRKSSRDALQAEFADWIRRNGEHA